MVMAVVTRRQRRPFHVRRPAQVVLYMRPRIAARITTLPTLAPTISPAAVPGDDAVDPLDVECDRRRMTMTSAMAETLDEAYERLHATGPEFDGFLSNHGPMAAEALVRHGHGDLVGSW